MAYYILNLSSACSLNISSMFISSAFFLTFSFIADSSTENRGFLLELSYEESFPSDLRLILVCLADFKKLLLL